MTQQSCKYLSMSGSVTEVLWHFGDVNTNYGLICRLWFLPVSGLHTDLLEPWQ